MAKLLYQALVDCGYDVDIISEFRSWEGQGSLSVQQEIKTNAEKEVERLKQKFRNASPPKLIFTYHVYHKAPDWIGAKIAEHLGIPYVIAEASYAPKQANGPWQLGHNQTKQCIQRANSIIALNPADLACVEPLLTPSQSTHLLLPFIQDGFSKSEEFIKQRYSIAQKYQIDVQKTWLICVAMMRHGDKAASYQHLAKTLNKIDQESWHLIVIGDGPAHNQIVENFDPMMENCTFLGQQSQSVINHWLSASNIFVWPAINEAYGLALLEAMACDLPIVAQNYGGVSTIVENNQTGYVTDPGKPDDYLSALENLINNKSRRQAMSLESNKKFTAHHTNSAAVKKIKSICESVV